VRRFAAIVLAGLVVALPASAAPTVPRLAHVVVIVFENHERSAVLGSGAGPTFDSLAKRYANLTNYYADTHPSLPNYLELVSGSSHGITSDCTACSVSGPSIGTLLTRAHDTWTAFAEGYPSSPTFAKKHMPFLYFAGEASHVKPLAALHPKALPEFSFVAPDLCHDMHDCSVATGDRWLARFVAPLLTAPRTAVFVLFDEGSSDAHGGGHVAAIVAGTAVRRGVTDGQPATHSVVLRTIEDALGLSHLGASARVRPLAGIWR
jgi:hypothetical protein